MTLVLPAPMATMDSSLHSTGASVYYPSQKPYTMAVASTAHLLESASTSRYTSLYSGTRNDLDLLPVRRETFIFYPPSAVPTPDIAAAGFYFTGNRDICRCYRCRLEINRLKAGDDPMEIHRHRSPSCPFVKAQNEEQRRNDNAVGDVADDTVDGYSDSDDSESPSESSSDVEMDGVCDDDDDEDDDDVTAVGKLEFTGTAARYVETSAATAACTVAAIAADSCTHAAARHRRPKVAKPIDKEALRKENARLRSTITCRQCRSAKVQTLFLPCRHLVTCEECAEKMDDCIHCGQKILGTVRTFLI